MDWRDVRDRVAFAGGGRSRGRIARISDMPAAMGTTMDDGPFRLLRSSAVYGAADPLWLEHGALTTPTINPYFDWRRPTRGEGPHYSVMRDYVIQPPTSRERRMPVASVSLRFRFSPAGRAPLFTPISTPRRDRDDVREGIPARIFCLVGPRNCVSFGETRTSAA